MTALSESFWSRVDKTTGCWVWQGRTTKAGYGQLMIASRFQYAHRVAYADAYGAIPDGMLVCHKCDNPPCVRPAHLFLGTNADNMRDKAEKGRATRSTAKVTEAQVRAIRAAAIPQRKLADLYGVSQAAISDIKTGRRWSKVA